jgi:Protein of unknown function (DUF2889)
LTNLSFAKPRDGIARAFLTDRQLSLHYASAMATFDHDDAKTRPVLNRVIRIAASKHVVRVALEDDFHHFRVALHHDGHSVTAIESEGLRTPWSLCPAAGKELRALIGAPIVDGITSTVGWTDARNQCTHQFDMAALAIAAAARGNVSRRYDVAVDDPRLADRHARLARDGVPLLDWTLDDQRIVAPAPFTERTIGSGFTAWAAATFDPDGAEAALVLRRGVFISRGRPFSQELDAMRHAHSSAGCWVTQPGRAPQAVRNVGSQLDFDGRRDALTRADDAWLADTAGRDLTERQYFGQPIRKSA